MKIRKILCLALCLLCLVNACAFAQTVRGNLEERFSDEDAVEHNGVSYQIKNRLTTMLFLGIAPDQAGGIGTVEFLALLVADDDTKTMNVLELNCATAVPGVDGQTLEQLRSVYARGMDADEGCQLVLAALNSLLPSGELVEHYFALDMNGLELIDGQKVQDMDAADMGASFKSRLKVIKADVEQRPSSEWNDLFVTLSDYITTDMKSGAVMRVIDKADRFDVYTDVEFAGELQVDEAGAELFLLDEGALLDASIGIFYEEKNW